MNQDRRFFGTFLSQARSTSTSFPLGDVDDARYSWRLLKRDEQVCNKDNFIVPPPWWTLIPCLWFPPPFRSLFDDRTQLFANLSPWFSAMSLSFSDPLRGMLNIHLNGFRRSLQFCYLLILGSLHTSKCRITEHRLQWAYYVFMYIQVPLVSKRSFSIFN